MGFPDSSVGKESTCNAEDPGWIPGLGRSTGEGIGYPLQYSWASLVAQLVKNPSAMRETWVWSLGWEDPLEKGKGYQLQYSGLENPGDYTVRGVSKSQTRLSGFHFHLHLLSFSFGFRDTKNDRGQEKVNLAIMWLWTKFFSVHV